MSDQSNVEPSHESVPQSSGKNVDKDRNRTSQSLEGTAAKKPGLGATSATATQDTDNAHHGVFVSAQNVIHSATETIKHFLPGSSSDSASQPIEGEPQGSSGHRAAKNVKQSKPESRRTKTSGEVDSKDSPLPSKEIPGGSRIGVGSLPGHLSEVSVAKLPEERRQENLPSHETDHEQLGKTGGVGPLPGGPNESGVALLPEERAHPVDEAPQNTGDVEEVSSRSVNSDDAVPEERPVPSVKLPKESYSEALPSSGESDVAIPQEHVVRDSDVGSNEAKGIAPDESQSQPGAVPTSHDQPARQGGQDEDSPAFPPGLGASDSSGARGRSGSEVGPTTTLKPTQEAQASAERSEGIHQGRETTRSHVREKRRSKSGNDGSASKPQAEDTSDKQPEQSPHSISTSDIPADSVSEGSPPGSAQSAPMTASRKHRASTGSTPARKAGFMDRMKGEAMILSGKLGKKKNEKKVEEGECLMGK